MIPKKSKEKPKNQIAFGSERKSAKKIPENELDELTIIARLGQKVQTQIPRCQKFF